MSEIGMLWISISSLSMKNNNRSNGPSNWGSFISNCFRVLFGYYSWVGYGKNPRKDLPSIRPSVLTPSASATSHEQLNKSFLNYAKDYKIENDLKIIFKWVQRWWRNATKTNFASSSEIAMAHTAVAAPEKSAASPTTENPAPRTETLVADKMRPTMHQMGVI